MAECNALVDKDLELVDLDVEDLELEDDFDDCFDFDDFLLDNFESDDAEFFDILVYLEALDLINN